MERARAGEGCKGGGKGAGRWSAEETLMLEGAWSSGPAEYQPWQQGDIVETLVSLSLFSRALVRARSLVVLFLSFLAFSFALVRWLFVCCLP
eukprot:759362-Rhodomonas_salina.1